MMTAVLHNDGSGPTTTAVAPGQWCRLHDDGGGSTTMAAAPQ